ncbi:MAG: methyltransferase domain-containing protein [Alphaproteobacteria bacterium]|nr:methyltransferase domain-containing protein [Alphaproteobacteria bacterium]
MAILGFLKRGDDKHEGQPGHSMGKRLHAWWEGYDLPPAEPAAEAEGSRATTPPPDGGVIAATAPDPWSKSRIKVAEMIWGDGFNFPGSADHVVELVKPFGLTKEKSLLDLGCGLGGGTRAIAKEFGTWVEGMEQSPALARAGMEMSEKAGLGKKATVVAYDPAKVHFTPRRYEAAFARMVLWQLADKKRLLGEIDKGLKPQGQLTFIDYVIKPGAAGAAGLGAWLKAENCANMPCELADVSKMLETLKIDIRIAEDMTGEFRRLVTEGWAKAVEILGAGASGLAPEEAQALVREAEMWRMRINLLDGGTLQVARFFGIKR